jgi:hypothetical protein
MKSDKRLKPLLKILKEMEKADERNELSEDGDFFHLRYYISLEHFYSFSIEKETLLIDFYYDEYKTYDISVDQIDHITQLVFAVMGINNPEMYEELAISRKLLFEDFLISYEWDVCEKEENQDLALEILVASSLKNLKGLFPKQIIGLIHYTYTGKIKGIISLEEMQRHINKPIENNNMRRTFLYLIYNEYFLPKEAADLCRVWKPLIEKFANTFEFLESFTIFIKNFEKLPESSIQKLQAQLVGKNFQTFDALEFYTKNVILNTDIFYSNSNVIGDSSKMIMRFNTEQRNKFIKELISINTEYLSFFSFMLYYTDGDNSYPTSYASTNGQILDYLLLSVVQAHYELYPLKEEEIKSLVERTNNEREIIILCKYYPNIIYLINEIGAELTQFLLTQNHHNEPLDINIIPNTPREMLITVGSREVITPFNYKLLLDKTKAPKTRIDLYYSSRTFTDLGLSIELFKKVVLVNDSSFITQGAYFRSNMYRFTGESVPTFSAEQVKNWLKRYLTKLFIDKNSSVNDHVIHWYNDYLEMCSQIKREPKLVKCDSMVRIFDNETNQLIDIPEIKYLHDNMVHVYNEAKLEIENEQIKTIYEKFNYLEEIKIDGFQIVVPKTATEIVNEGIALDHCVASYVSNITKDKFIIFVRKENELDTSLYTLEIRTDNGYLSKPLYDEAAKKYQTKHIQRKERLHIHQFRGYNNQLAPHELVKKFVKKFKE